MKITRLVALILTHSVTYSCNSFGFKHIRQGIVKWCKHTGTIKSALRLNARVVCLHVHVQTSGCPHEESLRTAGGQRER